MYYTVYKTINLVTGKFYIGVHKTSNPNDKYMGSGELIKSAIKKHGRENFVKQILYVFDNEIDAYEMEASIVTEALIKQGDCYNMHVGGFGKGIQVANALGINNKGKTAEHYQKMRSAFLEKSKTQEFITKRSKHKPFLNRKHSDDTKQLMSKSLSETSKGERNSQFGTCWITDGVANKKINKSDVLPENWRYGRTTK